MTNRPLYIRKLTSTRLKAFNYNITIGFDESKELKEIIGLAENQILRSVRDISKKTINRMKLERLIIERDKLKKKKCKKYSKEKYKTITDLKESLEKFTSDKSIQNESYKRLKFKCDNLQPDYTDRIEYLQNKINRTMFVEDYITVVIDHPTHYKYMYENGFIINGKTYRRLSCSAGQARVSTVVFVCEDIIDELKLRLNNGRDLTKAIAASKFNAYFGLAGSATHIVSDPKFIVIKDYENVASFMANYVIENGWKVDDTIIQKEMKNMPMNRTDGMGLIKYSKALEWSQELGLDYVPSQFCIRQNFIKGMLCVFPIEEFCKEKNNGSYMVDTIYKDKEGNYIKADLRDYDVILTESQFKLWDSFSSVEQYVENCHKNKLYWGISLHTPKKAKNILKLNYQFIQTLNLNKDDIQKLASQFVDWICGVSYDNTPYLLLFLLGINNNEEKIKQFIRSSDNYWIKSLVINPELKNDKYIRTKIRELIKIKIKNACMGDVFVDGNFEVLVSDPYGFMQHVCGLEVTGLLKEGQFYSNYWNELNVNKVDAMRSPLTYLSEHVILNLHKDDETEKWYKHCKLGIILNYHGHEVVNFGGADYDFDILATTSNASMIKCVYKNELPVVYDAPKPKKIVFTEDDLYNADTFSFGSIIGSITNKGSNGYALLPEIEAKFGTDSFRYKLLKSRLQQCCKAQSAQIDKAKIGRAVKGIPLVWTNKNKIKRNKKGKVVDNKVDRKTLYNDVLINKYPYFFRYLYRDTNKLYRTYVDQTNITCLQVFQLSLDELEILHRKTKEQSEFIENYYKYMPVIYSDSSMNMLCKYIESINFKISERTKSVTDLDIVLLYKRQGKQFEYTDEMYVDVITELQSFIKGKQFDKMLTNDKDESSKFNEDTIKEFKIDNECLDTRLRKICPNTYVTTNCLIDYFYIDKPTSNKDILWSTYGKYIFNNLKINTKVEKILFPFPQDKGNIVYLGETYELKEVTI